MLMPVRQALHRLHESLFRLFSRETILLRRRELQKRAGDAIRDIDDIQDVELWANFTLSRHLKSGPAIT